MEVAGAVPALRHLLDLLLLQLGPLRCPRNNPHEVPALQLILRPIPRNLVLQVNRARAQGSLDRWPLQLRKIEQFPVLIFFTFINCQAYHGPTDYFHSG